LEDDTVLKCASIGMSGNYNLMFQSRMSMTYKFLMHYKACLIRDEVR